MALAMKKVVEKLKELGCRGEHLDILVQDQKMQAANVLNSSGMEEQIRYLLTRMEPEEVVAAVKHEFEMLRRYNMKTQSKLPEGNVRRKHK
jgi:hypothetical protein